MNHWNATACCGAGRGAEFLVRELVPNEGICIRRTAGGGNENRTPVTAIGCFQDMSGSNNYVLSNVGDAPGAPPSDTRSYRIEQSGDFQQYVGKKVTVSGWVDADATSQGMPAGQAKSNELDFNDLPELHVEKISSVGEACGSATK